MKKYLSVLIVILLFSVFTLSACKDAEITPTYTISFESNGGSDVPDIMVGGNSRFTLPTKPTRAGYDFAGWFFDDNIFKVQLTEDYFVNNPITQNVKVYAKWTRLPGTPDPSYPDNPDPEEEGFVVTFDSNGGKVVAPQKTLKIDNQPDTKKPGKMFLGWYEGSIKVTFPLTVRRDMVLTAGWSEGTTYTKEFINGKTIITMGVYPQTVETDTDIIQELDALTVNNNLVTLNGQSYYKLTVSPILSNAKFVSTGESIIAGSTYYFRVEPVKWQVVNIASGRAALLSEKVLDITSYGNTAWEFSSLRSMSQNFLSSFSEVSLSVVKDTPYGSSADKVYAITDDENFITQSHKTAVATDFAAAKGLKTNQNGNADWLLRATGQNIYCFSQTGMKMERTSAQESGFRPGVTVEYFYTVTFENLAVDAFFGDTITVPVPVTEENETFLGYYASENYSGEPLGESMLVTADKTFYAKITTD